MQFVLYTCNAKLYRPFILHLGISDFSSSADMSISLNNRQGKDVSDI